MDIDSNKKQSRRRDENYTDGEESKRKENIKSTSTSDFSERTWKEDFTLIVENKKLYVSKAFLALSSPVFDRMFQSDFKEKNQTEMELPDKKVSDMQDFLRCIYPSIMADISDQNVFSVLPLAVEYQVSWLKSKCEAFLMSKLNDEISTDYLKNMLKHAADYNMKDVLAKCTTEISKKPVKDVDCFLKTESLPLKIISTIQDNMLRRLEQSEKDNARLEAINRYLVSGIKTEQQLDLQKYRGWTGKSIEFTLPVEDLGRYSFPRPKRFELFDADANYVVKNTGSPNANSLRLEISLDASATKNVRITVLGQFVIKNLTQKNENYTSAFKMIFYQGRSEQSINLQNTSVLFNVTEGYIYNDAMSVEIHLLLEKESLK
ncbi:uncharacterized protein LOC123561000 [Mercenaria mercenaria]|uniref:uncharacterized protein LOC123561000 n=1 Tax=Mercenaria mercenaria TaxID=6596 RepID=UPI00234F6A8F|nr:uncharacterized protein LOC123561000 [Mercenaria mercenaria]